jgi:hypothetical protein
MEVKATMMSEASARIHYWNRTRFLWWRWRLTMRGVKNIIAEVRLLKFLRRKVLQAREISFA